MISRAARAEWRANWPLVIAAMAGFSVSSLGLHSMGLFIAPLATEFGWSRAMITSSLTIYAALAAPLAPIAGILVDRLGSRRLAIPGVVLYAATFASLGAINGALSTWWALWSALALCSLAVHTSVWTAAIAGRFAAGRGLALAVTLCGTSLTQIIAPPLTNHLISSYGWRAAYLILGLGWGAVALTLIVAFFHDIRSAPRLRAPNASAAVAMGGLTPRQALRSPQILRIGAAELLIATITVSLIVHMVPILTWRGIALTEAAEIAGLVGFFAIAGKLLTGVLLDRKQSEWIPSANLWLPSVACIILMTTGSHLLLYLAAAIFGYAVGAYFQVITYLTSRYAGLANFGKIFGTMAALMAIGTGVGPFAASMTYDLTGSYVTWLAVCVALSVAAGVMVLRLGKYPDWSTFPSPRSI